MQEAALWSLTVCAHDSRSVYSGQSFHLLQKKYPIYVGRYIQFFIMEKMLPDMASLYGFPFLDIDGVMPYSYEVY